MQDPYYDNLQDVDIVYSNFTLDNSQFGFDGITDGSDSLTENMNIDYHEQTPYGFPHYVPFLEESTSTLNEDINYDPAMQNNCFPFASSAMVGNFGGNHGDNMRYIANTNNTNNEHSSALMNHHVHGGIYNDDDHQNMNMEGSGSSTHSGLFFPIEEDLVLSEGLLPGRSIHRKLANTISTRHKGRTINLPIHSRTPSPPKQTSSSFSPTSSGLKRSSSERKRQQRQAPYPEVNIDRSSTTPRRGRRVAPEEDHENKLIKEYRVAEGLNWKDIAKRLNKIRRRLEKPETFTEAAVYGRFKRNAPLIAKAEGDYSFNVDDYMAKHIRRPTGQTAGFVSPVYAHASSSGMPTHAHGHNLQSADGWLDDEEMQMQFTNRDDNYLSTIHDEVFQDLWEMVAERLSRLTEKDFDAAACAERWEVLRHGSF